MMFIPTSGQQFLIDQAMRGQAPAILHVIVSAAATTAVGVALVLVAINLYESEWILLG